jgi:hypothetical protein
LALSSAKPPARFQVRRLSCLHPLSASNASRLCATLKPATRESHAEKSSAGIESAPRAGTNPNQLNS